MHPASSDDGGHDDQDPRIAHTFKVKRSLLRECQRAVAFCAGHPHYLTMSDLLDDALQRQLQHLKKLVHKELAACDHEFPEPKRRSVKPRQPPKKN